MEIIVIVSCIVNILVLWAIWSVSAKIRDKEDDQHEKFVRMVDDIKDYFGYGGGINFRMAIGYFEKMEYKIDHLYNMAGIYDSNIQKAIDHLNSLEARVLRFYSIMEQNSTLSMMKSKSIEEMETSQLLEIIEECTSTLRTKKP